MMKRILWATTLSALAVSITISRSEAQVNQGSAASLLDPKPPNQSVSPTIVDTAIFLLRHRKENVSRASDRYVIHLRKADSEHIGNDVIYWKQIDKCVVRETKIETNTELLGLWNPGSLLGMGTGRLLGMGNSAAVIQYDLTKMATKGTIDIVETDIVIAFNLRPGFCKTLTPKNYVSPDGEGYRAWGDHYGPKPPYKPSYQRPNFYTDFFFGDRSLVPGTWYSFTDQRIRPWYLQQYKQRLRQSLDQIAQDLDNTEYDEASCFLSDRLEYKFALSNGIEGAKQAVQRIQRAREYVTKTFHCGYSDPEKPY